MTLMPPPPAVNALTPGTGFMSAISLLLGHELGHTPSRADRTAAQVINGLVGYGWPRRRKSLRRDCCVRDGDALISLLFAARAAASVRLCDDRIVAGQHRR
jgi:hypothetical protein